MLKTVVIYQSSTQAGFNKITKLNPTGINIEVVKIANA